MLKVSNEFPAHGDIDRCRISTKKLWNWFFGKLKIAKGISNKEGYVIVGIYFFYDFQLKTYHTLPWCIVEPYRSNPFKNYGNLNIWKLLLWTDVFRIVYKRKTFTSRIIETRPSSRLWRCIICNPLSGSEVSRLRPENKFTNLDTSLFPCL